MGRVWVDRLFQGIEAVLAALLLGMVLMVFGNVVLRYAFNSGILVSEEMSRYCFIWLTYIGAMIAMREREHLGVDTLVKHLPRAGKKACLFLSEALMLLVNVLFFIGTFKMHDLQVTNVSPVTGISMIWIYRRRLPGGRGDGAVQPGRSVPPRDRAPGRRGAGAGGRVGGPAARCRAGGAGGPFMTVTVFVGSLLAAMALGMPIAYALLVCGLALMAFMAATGALPAFDSQILAQRFVDGADNFPLLAVPFFLLAGEFMNAGGLSRRIVNLAMAWVGHFRGGLGYVACWRR
jgi:TRAP-type C4-dicarboxylate transport system permease small subunit